MADMDVRREIGDVVLTGHGYEFGAGLLPSRFASVERLTVIDKRSVEELAQLFGQRPDYEVLPFEQALTAPPVDFITAHQVAEHLPDPIGVLSQWLRLLRVGGTLFISVPSSNNVCERLREATPINHMVMDYILEADGSDFDSRQHIPSFINQWTVLFPDQMTHAQNGVAHYAEAVLSEQRRVQGHDLHWHTYTLDSFKQVIEAAFYLAGAGFAWGETRETDDALYAVAYRTTAPPQRPVFITNLVARLEARLAMLQPPLIVAGA